MDGELEGVDLEVHRLAQELDLPKENFVVKDGVIDRIVDRQGNITFTEYEPEEEEAGKGAQPKVLDLLKGKTETKAAKLALLTKAGYDLKDFNFKGKKLEDLTTEEEEEVILSEINKGKNVFRNQTELDVINFLRTGKSLKELADFVYEKDPKLAVGKLSNEDLVKKSIQEMFPEFTTEELAEEFEKLDEGTINRRANALRKRVEGKEPDLAAVSKEEVKKLQDAHVTEVTNLTNSVMDVDSIAGIKLTDEMRNEILNDIATEAYDQDSQLINDLTNPDGLIEVSFYRLYVPSIVEGFQKEIERVEKEAYERGKNEVLGKLPKTKLTATSLDTKPKEKVRELEEEEF